MFHISNIITLKSIYFVYLYSVMQYGIIWGWRGWGNSSNSRRIFTLKKNSSELWLLHIQEPLVEVFLKKLEILYFHIHIYIFIDKFHSRQLKKDSDKFISP